MSASAVVESAQRFSSAEQVVSALVERVSSVIRIAVQARGRASLLVPGGNTPVPIFKALAHCDLPWESVYITLTDERRVPITDPDSNAGLVKRHLLQDRAASAHFYPLHRDAMDSRADEAACGAALSMLPRPFDAVILGMGEDGHTASLFANDPALASALKPHTEAGCAATRAPKPPFERLSLTLATLLKSRWIGLPIHGLAKWRMLEQAATSADPMQYPIAAVLNQHQVPVHVYWSA